MARTQRGAASRPRPTAPIRDKHRKHVKRTKKTADYTPKHKHKKSQRSQRDRSNINIRSRVYIITANNYTCELGPELTHKLNLTKSISAWRAQTEVGDKCNTPHIQGAFRFTTQITQKSIRDTLKAIFGVQTYCRTAKWPDAVAEYAKKDETFDGKWRAEHGTWPKPLIDKVTSYRPWQQDVMNILAQEPSDRDVHWIYDEIGKMGKSAFTRHLLITQGYCTAGITGGTTADITNYLKNKFEANPTMIRNVILDIPRSAYANVAYKAIEGIKNGVLTNTKFEATELLFNSPHLIIFANSLPDTSRLSVDRWKIYDATATGLIRRTVE